jgi:glutathione S-transferase
MLGGLQLKGQLMSDLLALKGAPGSPYTRKMLALLRYRRIPYRLIVSGSNIFGSDIDDLPQPKVQLLPTFFFAGEDGGLEAVVDSTPIIRRLEEIYPGRSVLPHDPALRFLDYLLEDYADEWLTKAMFHYRWYYEADIEKAGAILPRWRNLTATEEELAPLSKTVRERQISRLYVVGSNDTTAPVIENSYKRLLQIMSAHMNQAAFMFGNRPGASDFGLYGQLTQLALFDPTPMGVAEELAMRVVAWVGVVDDLSGHEPEDDQWVALEDAPGTLHALFTELGTVYVPALLANAAAVDSGAVEVRTEIDGAAWVQEPFPYQAKCLQWIRQEFVRLDETDRVRVMDFLDATGCHELFAKPG